MSTKIGTRDWRRANAPSRRRPLVRNRRVEDLGSYNIAYSVLRLPARLTEPSTEIPIAGIRAGERKTC